MNIGYAYYLWMFGWPALGLWLVLICWKAWYHQGYEQALVDEAMAEERYKVARDRGLVL